MPRADSPDLDFSPESDGRAVRLRLRVAAGAARSRIAGPHGGALKLSVRTPPERGRANREVLGLVAGAFGLPASAVDLLSGETSPDKVVRIPLGPDEARARWAASAAAVADATSAR